MMLREKMTYGLTVAIAIGALALVGCNQKSSSDSNDGSSEVDALDPAGRTDGGSTDQGGSHNEAASLELDDSSAEGAMNTYLNRLKAGDLLGAAEVCVAGAPGTDSLLRMGQNIKDMENSPEDASLAETAKALFVGDLKTVESVKMIEEDGVVVYEVKALNKPAVNIRVEERDGVWWVIPPPDGLPFG